MKRLLVVGWILLMVTGLSAVGAFNMFNARNHPELHWKVLETEHYHLYYHEPLEVCAREAAAVCEATYDSLSAAYRVQPKQKIQVYISDQDEIANGATVFTWYVFVWVNQNDYIQFLTGNHKWLRAVLSHELSHYFMFYTISDWLTNFMPVSAISAPRDLDEGFAMYFSGEPWGHNRGDTYLRRAVLADNLDSDPSLADWGGVTYGSGFAFVRYLCAQYGEDKLIDMLHFRNGMKLFSLDDAFKKVYHKPLKDLREEWRRYVFTYYYHNNYVVNTEGDSLSVTTERTLEQPFATIDKMVFWDDQVLMYGKQSTDQPYRELAIYQYNADSLKIGKFQPKHREFIARGGLEGISLSPDHRYIVWSQIQRGQHSAYLYTVYRYDRKSHHRQRIAYGEDPVVTNAGDVYYHRLLRDRNRIYSWQNGKTTVWREDNPRTLYGSLQLSPDQSTLVVTIMDSLGVFRLEGLNVTDASVRFAREFASLPLQTLWNEQGELFAVVESEADRHRTLWAYRNGEWVLYNATAFNLNPYRIQTNGERLDLTATSEFSRGKPELVEISLWPGKPDPVPPTDYYNQWTTIAPKHSIPADPTPVEVKSIRDYNSWSNIKFRTALALPTDNALFGELLFSEPLGKHLFSFAGLVPYDLKGETYYYGMYQNRQLYPTISLSQYYTQWLGAYWENKAVYERRHDIDLNVNWPIDLIPSLFWSLNAGTDLAYHRMHRTSDTDHYDTPPMYQNGEYYSGGAFARLAYNLPYRNSDIHPIRKLELGYQISSGNRDLGMKADFTHHQADLEAAWAPFFGISSFPLLKTFSLSSDDYYETQNGHTLVQTQPGLDHNNHVLLNGQPFFHRPYLRGHNEDWISRSLLVAQNQVNFKLLDDLGLQGGFKGPWVSVGYLGVSGWFDYARLTDATWIDVPNPTTVNYRTMGIEAKAETQVLGIDFIQRGGKSFDMDGTDRGWYYFLDMRLGF